MDAKPEQSPNPTNDPERPLLSNSKLFPTDSLYGKWRDAMPERVLEIRIEFPDDCTEGQILDVASTIKEVASRLHREFGGSGLVIEFVGGKGVPKTILHQIRFGEVPDSLPENEIK